MKSLTRFIFFLFALLFLSSCTFAPVDNSAMSIRSLNHESENYFVPDITLTPSGGDDTSTIQQALNDCFNAQGGTVCLAKGTYTLTSNINIPAYVTLCGEDALIIANVESKDSNTEGLFILSGCSGVMGLTVYYPNQSYENVKPYPCTFYSSTGLSDPDTYMMKTVKNCTVINGYIGVGVCCEKDTNIVHEMLMVENLKGTFLYSGSEVYNQADVGVFLNVDISPKYYIDYCHLDTQQASKLKEYLKTNAYGLIISAMDWPQFTNISIDCCKTGILIPKGPRVDFSGCFANVNITNCTNSFDIKALDSRWGIVVASSNLEGSFINDSRGIVKISDVNISGPIFGNVKNNNGLSVSIQDPVEYDSKAVTNAIIANLDNTNATDCSAQLQTILDSATPGSVVYVKSGYYRFDNPITVPEGVELRGSIPLAQRNTGYNCGGTVFHCYYGDDSENNESDVAFITLNRGSGINGITIIYPENFPYDSDLNTTFAVRGTGNDVYMINSSIVAANMGVDFSNCDNHFIKQVCACCYKKTFVVGGKNGTITSCLQNGTVIARCSDPYIINRLYETELFSVLFDPILRQQACYITISHAQNENIVDVFAYGCATFFTANDSTASILNVGSDNIGKVQFDIYNSDIKALNVMRYNGESYDLHSGKLSITNRITLFAASQSNVVLNY